MKLSVILLLLVGIASGAPTDVDSVYPDFNLTDFHLSVDAHGVARYVPSQYDINAVSHKLRGLFRN